MNPSKNFHHLNRQSIIARSDHHKRPPRAPHDAQSQLERLIRQYIDVAGSTEEILGRCQELFPLIETSNLNVAYNPVYYEWAGFLLNTMISFGIINIGSDDEISCPDEKIAEKMRLVLCLACKDDRDTWEYLNWCTLSGDIDVVQFFTSIGDYFREVNVQEVVLKRRYLVSDYRRSIFDSYEHPYIDRKLRSDYMKMFAGFTRNVKKADILNNPQLATPLTEVDQFQAREMLKWLQERKAQGLQEKNAQANTKKAKAL